MDFGEILKLWNARTGDAPEPRDRDSGESSDAGGLSRRRAESMPVDARLDLHGLTADEAELALERFFGEAERSGCRKVLIVHGKGLHSASEPVLGRLVARWLERRASAGRTGHPDAANGGNGATWVILKGNQRSR